MAKRVTGIPTDCEGNIVGNGRPVSGKAPKRAKRGDFDITLINNRRQRWARNLWG